VLTERLDVGNEREKGVVIWKRTTENDLLEVEAVEFPQFARPHTLHGAHCNSSGSLIAIHQR